MSQVLQKEIINGVDSGVWKIDWTANGAGAATEALLLLLASRKIKYFKTVPDTVTSEYTVKLVDEDDTDWLFNAGADRSTTLSEVETNFTDFRLPSDQNLTLNISGAGAGNRQSSSKRR